MSVCALRTVALPSSTERLHTALFISRKFNQAAIDARGGVGRKRVSALGRGFQSMSRPSSCHENSRYVVLMHPEARMEGNEGVKKGGKKLIKRYPPRSQEATIRRGTP